jgi:hypothetical protein
MAKFIQMLRVETSLCQASATLIYTSVVWAKNNNAKWGEKMSQKCKENSIVMREGNDRVHFISK